MSKNISVLFLISLSLVVGLTGCGGENQSKAAPKNQKNQSDQIAELRAKSVDNITTVLEHHSDVCASYEKDSLKQICPYRSSTDQNGKFSFTGLHSGYKLFILYVKDDFSLVNSKKESLKYMGRKKVTFTIVRKDGSVSLGVKDLKGEDF